MIINIYFLIYPNHFRFMMFSKVESTTCKKLRSQHRCIFMIILSFIEEWMIKSMFYTFE